MWKRRVVVVVVAVFVGSVLVASAVHAATKDDFQAPVPRYEACDTPGCAAPVIVSEDGNRFLRIVSAIGGQFTSVTYPVSDPGAHPYATASFRFRITPPIGATPADGMAFALLNTASYAAGPVSPALICPSIAEEPNFDQSIGVGIDVFSSRDVCDPNANHVSIHWGGKLYATQDRVELPLASGTWIRAELVLQPAAPPATS
jgi:hypothetical protein